MNMARRLMSPYSTVTPAARNKCQVEKDDDIKPSADQIRQGEGVKQMTVKTSIMDRVCFGLTPFYRLISEGTLD